MPLTARRPRAVGPATDAAPGWPLIAGASFHLRIFI